ncbi:MAG TPA: hypothetical protein VHV82_01960 [Sporichthyaceae bacterium]|nr:hypothetical protein [Sporichthyaceae bacterium]
MSNRWVATLAVVAGGLTGGGMAMAVHGESSPLVRKVAIAPTPTAHPLERSG